MFLSQTLGPLMALYDNIDDRVKHLSLSGFKCFDVPFFSCFKKGSIYFSDDYMKVVEEYREAIKKYDMKPVQAHEPEGNSVGDDNGEYYMKKTPRSIEMAAKIGCPSITIHPGHANTYAMTREEFVCANVKAIKKLLPYAEEYGIELLLENIEIMDMAPVNGIYMGTAQDLIDVVDEVNHPLLNVNWDIGHANFNGLNEYDEIKKLGSRIHGIHVHDNLGFKNFESYGKYISGDMHTHPLFGNVNYDDVIRALIETGYRGTFNFEVGTPSVVSYSQSDPKLMELSRDIRDKANTMLCAIGKLLLEKYNLFEG